MDSMLMIDLRFLNTVTALFTRCQLFGIRRICVLYKRNIDTYIALAPKIKSAELLGSSNVDLMNKLTKPSLLIFLGVCQ